MWSIAQTVFLEAPLGAPTELPRAGSTLEHPLVFDFAAREFKAMAERGLVEILSEHVSETMGESIIDRLQFRRLQ